MGKNSTEPMKIPRALSLRRELRFAVVPVFLLLCVSLACSQAVWEPPADLSVSGIHRPTVGRELVTAIRIAGIDVVLEETQLSDVRSRLGGTIGTRGDASEALAWLCLHGSDEGGRWAIWLEAGEIHGGAVGAFQLRRINAGEPIDTRCQALGSDRRIDLPAGLRLGLAQTQAVKTLGAPTATAGDTSLYAHEHVETIGGETATASNTLTVRLRGSVIDAIDVWKMTVS